LLGSSLRFDQESSFQDGKKRKSLRIPVPDVLANIALSEGEIRCQEETCLVIDNFHLLTNRTINEMKSSFTQEWLMSKNN